MGFPFESIESDVQRDRLMRDVLDFLLKQRIDDLCILFKNSNFMSLEQQISKGIMEAMKAKDTVRLGALRNAKKYIIEAKTAGPEITELPDADVLKIISKLAKQGTDSAAIFTEQNRPDLAAEELAQVAVFQEFLPKQLTAEELAAEVKAVIAEVGATSMKEMGKVMGVASKRLAGRADGKDISAKVKELLA